MEPFRVALSGDFRKADGTPDLSELRPRAAHRQAEHRDALGRCRGRRHAGEGPRGLRRADPARAPLRARSRSRRTAGSPRSRASASATTTSTSRPATSNGIAAVITPDGVRRPVAVSIITFILALSQKLLIKDRLTRQGPPGWAKRVDFMGEGLIGKTLGQLGMGNIGAEVFRMAAPFGMKFIAHDPYIDKAKAAELGVEVVVLRRALPPRRLPVGQRAALRRDAALRQRRAAEDDEADRLPHQHGARADRRPEGALPGADRQARSPAPGSTCSRSSRRPPTSRSTSSTTSSSRRTRSAGPTSVSPATAPPTSRRSLEVMHGREPRGVVNKDVLARSGSAASSSKRRLGGVSRLDAHDAGGMAGLKRSGPVS